MNLKKCNNNKSTKSLGNCMIQCHFCTQPFQKADISLAKCCMKRCYRHYCISCIQKHFNPEFDMQMYKKDTWICYQCQGICQCERCKKAENNSAEKKVIRKKSRVRMQGQESIELSGSNLSQSNLRGEVAVSHLQEDDLLLEFNELEQENAQQVPEFRLYSEDEMIQFPPFYRKIAERRNQFYNFILKDCRKRKPIGKYGRDRKQEVELDKNE